MHVQIVKVVVVWPRILFRRKPRQSFPKDKDSQRICTVKKHINPEIKLEVVNQVGLVQVLLHYVLIVISNVDALGISSQKDALSLARRNRFHYKSLRLFLSELVFEV